MLAPSGILPDGPLPDVRLMTEQCHLSGSNASREKLSYSHGANVTGSSSCVAEPTQIREAAAAVDYSAYWLWPKRLKRKRGSPV